MKTFFGILFAAMIGTGCYTQVKSSGDYWGYTGTHHRENVEAAQNQPDSLAYPDSTTYTIDQRGRDDDGYSYDNSYNDNFYNAPNYAYNSAPYVSLSFGFGWHRPWWDIGYASYYPYWYPSNYDPYWDWYYQPGFLPYGCLAPVYPYYSPFYRSFYHPYYSEHFGYFHHGFFDGGRILNSGARTGRIGSGENRGRTGAMSRSGVGNASSVGRAGSAQPRSNGPSVAAPGRGSSTGRIGSHSANLMNAPRNNPRLVPPNTRQGGRVSQAYPPRGPGYGSRRTVPSSPGFGGGARTYGGGNSGGGRSSGGGRGSRAEEGGRSGGGRGRDH